MWKCKRCILYSVKCILQAQIFLIEYLLNTVGSQNVSELSSTGQEKERTVKFWLLHARVEVVLHLGPRLRDHRSALLPLNI